jgi:hypothetical protein
MEMLSKLLMFIIGPPIDAKHGIEMNSTGRYYRDHNFQQLYEAYPSAESFYSG